MQQSSDAFFFAVLHQGSLTPGATTPLREQVLLLLQNLSGSRSSRCLKAAACSVAALISGITEVLARDKASHTGYWACKYEGTVPA